MQRTSLFDDKAKVPIGVTTANKHSPLIMHVNYEMHLPDHDFVKATKHKLHRQCILLVKIVQHPPKLPQKFPTQVQLILLFTVVTTTPVQLIRMAVTLY